MHVHVHISIYDHTNVPSTSTVIVYSKSLFNEARLFATSKAQGIPVVRCHGLVDKAAHRCWATYVFIDPVATIPASQVVSISEASQHAILTCRLPIEGNNRWIIESAGSAIRNNSVLRAFQPCVWSLSRLRFRVVCGESNPISSRMERLPSPRQGASPQNRH